MLISCVPGWKSVNGKGYNIFLLIFAFFIPLLIMIFCSVSKYRHLKKVKNQKENIRRKALKSIQFTNVFLRRLSTRSPMKRLHVAQLKGIKRASEWYKVHFFFIFTLSTMLQILLLHGTFLLCWSPYAMLALAGVFGLDDVVPVEITVLTLYFAKVSRNKSSYLTHLINYTFPDINFMESHYIRHDQRGSEYLKSIKLFD